MAEPIGALRVDVGLNSAAFHTDSGRLVASVTSTIREVERMGRTLQNVGGHLQRVGSDLSLKVSAPLLGVGGAAAKMSIEFESAFAGVKKTVDGADEDFARLEEGYRNMAKEVPQSAAALARLGETGGQLGVAKENLLGFTRVVADMGVATNMTAEQAANDFARISNITGMPQSAFSNLGSTVVALGNKSVATESEITSMGLRISAAGTLAKMSVPEIMALAATLSSVGLEAEAGGTAASRVLKEMVTAVAEGGDKLGIFAAVAGTTSGEFAQAFRDNASQALLTFMQGLGQLSNESGAEAIKVLGALGLEEIRVADMAIRTGNAHGLLKDSLALAAKSWEENTALSEEARKRYQTTESQLLILKNRVVDVGISLGNAMKPAIVFVVDALGNLIPKVEGVVAAFGRLPNWVQVAAGVGVLSVALSGPLLYGLGSVATSFGNLARMGTALARTPMGTTFATWAASTLSVHGAVGQLGNSVPVLTARVALLNASTKLTAVTLGPLHGLAAGAGVSLGTMAVAVTAAGVAAAVTTKGLISMGDQIRGIDDPVKKAALDVGLFEGAWILLGDAFKAVGPFLSSLVSKVVDFGSAVLEAASKLPVLSGVVEALRGAISNIAESFSLLSDQVFKLGLKLYDTGPSAEQLAAKARDLAEASKLAGREVTDWGEAQRIIGEHLKRTREATLQAAGASRTHAQADREGETASRGKADAVARAAEAAKRKAEADKKAEEATRKATEAVTRHREEVSRLADQLSGRAMAQEAEKLAEALSRPGVTEALTQNRHLLDDAAEKIRALVPALDRVPEPLARILALEDRLVAAERQKAREMEQTSAILSRQTDLWRGVGEISVHAGGLLATAFERRIALAREEIQQTEAKRQEDLRVIEVLREQGVLSEREYQKRRAELGEVKEKTRDWSGAVSELARAFVALGGDAGSAFGQILGGLSGAMEGTTALLASIKSGNIAGAIAGATQAVAGALSLFRGAIDLFTESASERAMKEVGRKWGVAISEGLAEKIGEDARRLGDEVAARLVHIADIIKEAGGVEAFGVDKAIAGLRDLFSAVEAGTLSVKEAGKAFDEAFGEVAAASIDRTTGLASAGLVELIGLSQRFGFESQAVTQFMNQQAEATLGGLKAFVEGATVTSQEAATAMGAAVAGVYQKLLESGVPAHELMEKVGPLVASLREQFAAAGFDGGAAFAQIEAQAALMADEVAGPAIKSILGLGDGLVGLHNMGILNQEMFSGLTQQISDTFAKLQEEGKGGEEALGLIRPSLQRVWELQQDFGYEVDASTQKLLDQAVQAGLVGDAHRDAQERTAIAMERTATLMEALLRKLGVEIPEAARRGAQGIEDAFAGVQVPEIKVPYVYEAKNERPPGMDVPSFAHGGIGDFGSGTLALLHGREAIVPLDGGHEAFSSTEVRDEIRALRSELLSQQTALPRAIGRAVRDAMLLAA